MYVNETENAFYYFGIDKHIDNSNNNKTASRRVK